MGATWEKGEVALIGRAPYRIGQFGRALAPWVPTRDRALAAALLTPAQLDAFRRMAPADQRHAVRVARLLLAGGARDPDLLVAALLHDLGKVAIDGRGRVRLPHRVTKVLLLHFAPGVWCRLSDRPGGAFLRGYYLLQHHPALGATWAARLGTSARACALIAAHEGGATLTADDAALAAALRHLREADDRS